MENFGSFGNFASFRLSLQQGEREEVKAPVWQYEQVDGGWKRHYCWHSLEEVRCHWTRLPYLIDSQEEEE
jgi:hypothetical protein